MLNNLKDLDPSYKMGLDFWNCSGSKIILSYNWGNMVTFAQRWDSNLNLVSFVNGYTHRGSNCRGSNWHFLFAIVIPFIGVQLFKKRNFFRANSFLVSVYFIWRSLVVKGIKQKDKEVVSFRQNDRKIWQYIHTPEVSLIFQLATPKTINFPWDKWKINDSRCPNIYAHWSSISIFRTTAE